MLSNSPILSVILPAYNAEKYVNEAINSILNQTFVDFEVIIADDGSQDKTRAIIDSYDDSRIIVSHNQSNQGKVATVNRLYRLCKGKYITIHDADDISVKNRFEKVLSFLEENQSFALCGSDFTSFKGNKVIGKSNLESDPAIIRNKIKNQSVFHGPTVFFKREIVGKVGGLYRYFEQAEDIDFTMRVIEKFNGTNIKDHLYLYRYVPESLTKKINGFNVKRMVDSKLLYELRKQRESRGSDMIMDNNIDELNVFTDKWKKKLSNDIDAIYRYGAFHNLSLNMYWNSMILAFLSVKENTLNILNIKCLVYVIIKTIKDYLFNLFHKREMINDYL